MTSEDSVRPVMFLFVAGKNDKRPAYYIHSLGFIERFDPKNCYAKQGHSVGIGREDMEAMLSGRVGREGILDRCDELYDKWSRKKISPNEMFNYGDCDAMCYKLGRLAEKLGIGQ